MMSATAKKLDKFSIFNDLSSLELTFLAPHVIEKKFHLGDYLLYQGIYDGNLYIILSGIVAVMLKLPGDSVKETTTLNKGQVIGEMSFLASALITSSVVAKTDVTCLMMSQNVLTMLRVAYPGAAFKIEHAIAMQTAAKIARNLERMLLFLKSVPKIHRFKSDHACYLVKHNAITTVINNDELSGESLASTQFFQSLSTSDIDIILQFMQVKSYEKGFQFSLEDASLHKVNLIYSGAVMLFLREGNELIKSIAVTGSGGLFIQNFINTAFCSYASYVTCEPSIILELNVDNYLRLRQLHPALFYTISQPIHRTIVEALYIVNRQSIRFSCEYNDLNP